MKNVTRFTFKFRKITTCLLALALVWLPVAYAKDDSSSTDKSDLNSDQSVDLQDLVIFSTNYLETYWETVDWCQFYENTVSESEFEGHRAKYFRKHFTLLLAYINAGFKCGAEPYLLDLENEPEKLLRIAQNWHAEGDYYITDARVGSLFIYDLDLGLKGEIKGLSKPLGVAVDSLGYVLVGNDGRDNIEVYDPADGVRLVVFGEGLVQMPTAITIAPNGEIYVTDSRGHNVRVFDDEYNLVRTIGSRGKGEAQLDFPTDTEIITRADGTTEVFVADQGNRRVQVYSADGAYLRTIGYEDIPPPPKPIYDNDGNRCGWFNPPPECVANPIEFIRLQALSSDSLGRLHVLDAFESTISVFDPADGTFIDAYGKYGEEAGFLRLPMDILTSNPGQAIVIAGDKDRIEILGTP